MSIEQTSAGAPPGRRAATAGPGDPARFVGSVLAWLALWAAVAVLAVSVLVPRLGGATPYTVLTGSMRPSYPEGTMVVARPVAADRISLGQVITFQIASGQPEVATHRVVAIADHDRRGFRFQTKGDANNTADQQWVRPEQIRGELWYSVPYLGYVSQLLTGGQRQWGVLAVAVLLLGYAGTMFASASRERRRARKAVG